MKKITFIILILVNLIACDKEQVNNDEVTLGKNYFTTLVEGDQREYYVHIPSTYDPEKLTPVVFMLHGTTGNGLKFYNISGWKELGDVENIITVYPSSWKYCVIDDGIVKNTTKWNVYSGTFEYCEGEEPRDDIKFLRKIITEISQKYNVDNNRIYLAGFSNGGQMAFRCAVEMSDLFAAIVESAGTNGIDSTLVPPEISLPITFQLGNSDDKWFGSDVDIPLSKFDSLLSNEPHLQGIIKAHTYLFDFESNYTLSGDPNSMVIATFKGKQNQINRTFNIVLFEGLEHNYPNGKNHPMKGAELNWEWMKQYSIE